MVDVYWVEDAFPGRVGVSALPRGGAHLERELANLAAQGVTALVSALPSDELEEVGLSQISATAAAVGLDHHWLPIRNLSVPKLADVQDALHHLARDVQQGGRVAVHCFGGIGRSPLLVSALLVLLGYSAEHAWGRVAQARGRFIPDTSTQRQWVFDFEAVVRGNA